MNPEPLPPTPIAPPRHPFPGGKWKALVMSYDDGHIQDRRLVALFNAHSIRGSFHLNSGFLDTDTFLSRAEVPALYAGHEISSHTATHPHLDQISEDAIRREIETDLEALSRIAGHPVRSFSYPFGTYNSQVLSILRRLGVTSARTIQNTNSLHAFPADPLLWHPTCHHSAALDFARQLTAATEPRPSLLYIWGHSYEFDRNLPDNSWDHITRLCSLLGHRDDIWYATVSELAHHLASLPLS